MDDQEDFQTQRFSFRALDIYIYFFYFKLPYVAVNKIKKSKFFPRIAVQLQLLRRSALTSSLVQLFY